MYTIRKKQLVDTIVVQIIRGHYLWCSAHGECGCRRCAAQCSSQKILEKMTFSWEAAANHVNYFLIENFVHNIDVSRPLEEIVIDFLELIS